MSCTCRQEETYSPTIVQLGKLVVDADDVNFHIICCLVRL